MNPNQALWERRLYGDCRFHAAIRRSSLKSIGITPPVRALDLGCGDATTAVPLARMGADVLGIDDRRISMVKDTYYFASPEKSPTEVIDIFVRVYGPTMNAFEAAQKNGKAG